MKIISLGGKHNKSFKFVPIYQLGSNKKIFGKQSIELLQKILLGKTFFQSNKNVQIIIHIK